MTAHTLIRRKPNHAHPGLVTAMCSCGWKSKPTSQIGARIDHVWHSERYIRDAVAAVSNYPEPGTRRDW